VTIQAPPRQLTDLGAAKEGLWGIDRGKPKTEEGKGQGKKENRAV